jgi:hypothetical protein
MVDNSYQLDFQVGGKYRLREKIGSGSFGGHQHCPYHPHLTTINALGLRWHYLMINIISRDQHQTQFCESQTPSALESKFYKALASGIGVHFVWWFRTECDYNTMVMDLLGPSLEDLFNFFNHKFSLKTVLLPMVGLCTICLIVRRIWC